jgi:hypothetical protein
MNLKNKNVYIIAGIIAVVVIVALWLTNKVEVTVNDGGVNLSADKNPQKDKVSVEDIEKSKVDIENRKDQDVTVKKVTDGSDVKVK